MTSIIKVQNIQYTDGDAQVKQAFDLKVVKTAEERDKEVDNKPK